MNLSPRPWSLPLLFCLAGCPRKPPPAASVPPPPISAAPSAGGGAVCPEPLMPFDVAQCPADGTRGLQPEAPLEWGTGASAGRLWMGRLSCPDGAMPEVARLGNIGAAPAQSASPSSGVPAYDRDVLDLWVVQCPSDPPELQRQWVTNIYRCGDLCPPQGFGLLPAEAYGAMVAAGEAIDAGDTEAAVAEAARAVALAPGFELPYAFQAGIHMALDDAEGALLAFEGASRFAPDRVESLYPRVVLLRELGRAEEANPLALRLLERTPADHPERPAAACMAALALRDQGEAARSDALAAEACSAGFTLCCTLVSP